MIVLDRRWYVIENDATNPIGSIGHIHHSRILHRAALAVLRLDPIVILGFHNCFDERPIPTVLYQECMLPTSYALIPTT